MKIFDCTTYFDEELLMDVRFNILNEKVEKFIVVESCYSHSGKKKALNFKIDNYKKFKDKIIYIVIEKEPDEINRDENLKSIDKRANSLKRIDQSYEFMMKGIDGASNSDLIILSDNDEIPNLNSNQFLKSKSDIIIFKQLFFYYKFNLFYDQFKWQGTKATRYKNFLSPQWLRNIKGKKYPKWRIATFFSKKKYTNLIFIENGGWHFTCLKTPEELEKKLINFAHHYEFEESGLKLDDLKKLIAEKRVMYDHTIDQKGYKWSGKSILKRIELSNLPDYISKNIDKYKDWID